MKDLVASLPSNKPVYTKTNPPPVPKNPRRVEEVLRLMIDLGFYHEEVNYFTDSSSRFMCVSLVYALNYGAISYEEFKRTELSINSYINWLFRREQTTNNDSLFRALENQYYITHFPYILLLYYNWSKAPRHRFPRTTRPRYIFRSIKNLQFPKGFKDKYNDYFDFDKNITKFNPKGN